MSEALSVNTKAILLLTAPLIAGRGERADLLKPSEYKKLAARLRQLEREPADLMASDAAALRADCHDVIDEGRLETLIGRGFLLSQAVEQWQQRAIWVISRADAAYPQRLKSRLKDDSPAVLYGCGEREILDRGGLAVVGSRHVDDALIEYTEDVGRLVASAGRTLVSGGAKGVDQAAMRGALEARGTVAGVLADGLERAALNRDHRNMLLEGQLVLISQCDPRAGFNTGLAMQRNKVIYALADAALVVSAVVDKGGSWAGATEQLDKRRLVPVYVRSTGSVSKGLDALRSKGALRWPNPEDAGGLDAALAEPVPEPPNGQAQLGFGSLGDGGNGEPGKRAEPTTARTTGVARGPEDEPDVDVADELYGTVRSLVLRVLREPQGKADVARALGVTQAQAEKWLTRLTEEGVLVKRTRPVRYEICELFLAGGTNGPAARARSSGPSK